MTKTDDRNSLQRLAPTEESSKEHKLSAARRSELAALELILEYQFSSPGLLDRALTHSSFGNSAPGPRQDYESLEFLGDAILGFVISDLLYHRFPELPEGELSKLRSSLVSRKQLARLSTAIGLDRFILLGPGEEQTGGRQKPAILGDVVESLIAAVYLDGGIKSAQRLIRRQFEPLLDEAGLRGMSLRDYKSRLQELLHARGLREPDYRIVREKGPDHRKEFLIEAWIDDRPVARAWGRSKKEAEQRVAQEVLAGFDSSPAQPPEAQAYRSGRK